MPSQPCNAIIVAAKDALTEVSEGDEEDQTRHAEEGNAEQYFSLKAVTPPKWGLCHAACHRAVGRCLDKALYLISALVSSNHDGQHQFHSQNGVSVFRSLLSEELSARQHRKVLTLITDLTDVDGEVEGVEQFSNGLLLKGLLKDLNDPDHDIKERAFLALISLSRRSETRGLLKAVGGLKAVNIARQQCKELLLDADEDYREILTNLIVLGSDLEDMLNQASSDKSEL